MGEVTHVQFSDPTGADAPVVAPVSTRPDNVPEKFWDATTNAINTDALLSSYGEMERKMGAPKPVVPVDGAAPVEPKADAPVPTPEEEAAAAAAKVEADKVEAEADKALEKSGLKMEDLQTEFDTNGALSEASYEKLAADGYDKGTVDDFIAFRASRANGFADGVKAEAGGEDAFTKMIAWAAEGYTVEQANAFNAAINSADPAKAKLAVTALKADFVKANGSRPALLTATSGTTAGGAYASMAEMLADQGNPQYAKDPAFRAAVQAKLSRSKI